MENGPCKQIIDLSKHVDLVTFRSCERPYSIKSNQIKSAILLYLDMFRNLISKDCTNGLVLLGTSSPETMFFYHQI